MLKVKTKFIRRRANLYRFERVTSAAQLAEGMTLIDKWGSKRNILSLRNDHIWLSHKYGRYSKHTGMMWPIETFIKNFKNWIFIPKEERKK